MKHRKTPNSRLFALAVITVGLGLALPAARLNAQDVTIGTPVTFAGLDDGQNRVPLKLKYSPKPEYPDSWVKANTYGYAIVFSPSDYDKAHGKTTALETELASVPTRNTTNIQIVYSCIKVRGNWRWDAKQNDPRQAWVAILFNPASASASKTKKDAAPRLLDVVPAFVPSASQDPGIYQVAKADVTVGVSGGIKDVKLTKPGKFALKNEAAVMAAVSKWKIAPARANGIPIEATINVPVLFLPDSLTDETKGRDVARAQHPNSQSDSPVQLVPTKEVATVYPKSAEAVIGESANVTLEFTLDDKGRPQNPVVVLSPNKNLDEPALKAIRAYSFATPDPSMPDSLGNTYAKSSEARWQYVVCFWRPSTDTSDLTDAALSMSSHLLPPPTSDYSAYGSDYIRSSYGFDYGSSALGVGYAYGFVDSINWAQVNEHDKAEGLPKGRNIDRPVLAPKSVKTVAPVYPYELLKGNVTGKATVREVCALGNARAIPEIIGASKKEFGLALEAAVRFYTVTPGSLQGRPADTMLNATVDFDPANPDLQLTPQTLQLLADETNNPSKIISEDKLDWPLKFHENSSKIPKAYINAKPEGTTIIEFLVDETGCVHLPRIIKTAVPEFAYVLMQRISMRVYDPPMRNGKPVVARAREEVNLNAMRKQQAHINKM